MLGADPGIDGPYAIAGGPDGALWFTNINNSTIGRLGIGFDSTPPVITVPDPMTTPATAIGGATVT